MAHLQQPSYPPVWLFVRASAAYPSFVHEGIARLTTRGTVEVTYEFQTLEEFLMRVTQTFRTNHIFKEAPPLPEGALLVNSYPSALVAILQEAWRRLRSDFRSDQLFVPGLRIVRRFDGL